MAKSHSKKRNVGLLREFLIRRISTALVDGDEKLAAKALKIVKKHFKPGTELYKEFRLLNAMIRTTVSSEMVASNILIEAKRACREHDVVRLEREKSALIHAINHKLNDETFFEQHVPNYRLYATIQTLINDWRNQSNDLEKIAQYEDQTLHWLMSEKHEEADIVLSEHDHRTTRMLTRVMMKKLNEKYSDLLPEQRDLLRTYALSQASNDGRIIETKISKIKNDLISSLNAESKKSNEYMKARIDEALQTINGEDVSVINDDVVTRFMLYSKMAHELGSEGDTE